MAFPLTIIQTSFSTVLTRYKEKAELVREGNAVHPATRKTGVASQTLDVRLHVLDGDVASLARLLVRLQSETHLHIEVLGPSGSNSPLNPASI